MNRSERLKLAQVTKRKHDVRIDTLRCKMPELDKLFEELRSGTAPNFLLIMTAISEMVAFMTDHDKFDAGDRILQKKQSQNKCRFCS